MTEMTFQKEYFDSEHESKAEYMRNWYKKTRNRVDLNVGRREYNRRYHATHKQEAKEWNREYHQRQRTIVLDSYGGKCACCGYSDVSKRVRGLGYLQIDHIAGGGRKMRYLGYGYGLYRYLIKNNFPSGYRVLCGACNAAIEYGAEKCEAHRQFGV